MAETHFDDGAIREWLSSDEFGDYMKDIVAKGAVGARAKATTTFTNRTGELFLSIGSDVSLETDGYHGFIKSSHVAWFVSNSKGTVAEVKPLVKGVMERTGKYRKVPSPVFLEAGLWLEGGAA